MKGKKAQVNKIFSATACLVVSLALAIFSCFAWFVNNRTSSSGLSSSVNGEYITDFNFTPYALTGKTESGDTTIYTVGDAYESDDDDEESFAIAPYGSSTASATLLVVTYNVKGNADTKTKITFVGNTDSPSVVIKDDGKDSDGSQFDYVQTDLSNAISMRLLDSQYTTYTTGDTVSSSNTERCFMDSTMGNAKQEAIFNDIEVTGAAKNSGYYTVTLNILIEYDDDNVTALYGMNSSASLSMPLGFLNDLNVTVEAADEEHTHTYSKWTVTEYTEETGIALLSDGGEEDDPYLYTATRTCTGCSSSTDGHTQTVNIKQSEIVTNSSTNSATATVTVGGEKCTITFSTAAASTGSSGEDAITVTTTIDLTSYGGDEISGITCDWNGITIDTTADGASFVPDSEGYVKITAGTVITINVATNATVEVAYYTGYSEGCSISLINGVATITFTDDTCITSITVTVPVTIESLVISGSSTTMYIDGSLTLSATVTLSDSSAYDGTITWTSSNTSVATVSDSGVVTAKGAGTVTITATATYDGASTSATYTITVTCENHTAGEAVIENEVEVTCTTDGSYDTVVYCTVCGEELSRTTTTIPAVGSHTYSESEWYYDSSTHWHECSVCGERIDEASHTYVDGTCTTCGASSTYTITYIPTATDTLTADSEAVSGLTVVGNGTDSSSGTYTGADGVTYSYRSQIKAYGSRYVTITIPDGLTDVTITIEGNGSSSGRVLVLASTTDVTASTDNGCIVASDGNGTAFEISASVSSGTYYIYSTSSNTVYLYAIKITFTVDETTSTTPTVSSVSVSGSSTSIDVGSTTYLWVSVTMSDYSSYSGTITWSSSDTSIATVDSSGTYVAVYAVGEGTATITATADGVSGTYEIYVIDSSAHTHTYEATFTWATDYSWAYVTLICSSCGDKQESFGYPTSETTAATCGVDGSTVYTFTTTCNDTTYTDTKTVIIAATGEHTYTWVYDDSEHWQVCSVCGTTTEAEAHTFENGTCTVCGATKTTATGTVSSVTISGDTSVTKGSSITLTATVTMSDVSAYSGTVSWESSDTSVATVDSSGIVTAVAAGKTTITATADGVTSDGYEITVSTENNSFSYTSLTEAISTAGVTLTDSMAVTQSYLTDPNDFLTIVDGGTVTVRDGSSTSKECIEVRNDALEVTFYGTGTITISFASTGGSNTSDIALKDSKGNYITADSGTSATASSTTGVYAVSGTTYVTITFTITEAGTYTIVAGTDNSRNTRVNSIVMVDTYVDTTNE